MAMFGFSDAGEEERHLQIPMFGGKVPFGYDKTVNSGFAWRALNFELGPGKQSLHTSHTAAPLPSFSILDDINLSIHQQSCVGSTSHLVILCEEACDLRA
jgi:hypothetical protein